MSEAVSGRCRSSKANFCSTIRAGALAASQKHCSVPKIASPEARKISIAKRIEKYFSVPKIASLEARRNFTKKTFRKIV